MTTHTNYSFNVYSWLFMVFNIFNNYTKLFLVIYLPAKTLSVLSFTLALRAFPKYF